MSLLVQDVCTAVSVSLHYLSLAVFCWMLVEGIHLYRQVVQVFDSARHKKTYVAIGYGVCKYKERFIQYCVMKESIIPSFRYLKSVCVS